MSTSTGSKKAAPVAKKTQQNTKKKGSARPEEEDNVINNITAAIAVADAIRTSLGPRGMDKMISSPEGEVIVSNDGATILQKMHVQHPTAKMLVELSKAQDVEAGDGTTSVTVIAGALLQVAQKLLDKGIHPTTIAESFRKAAKRAVESVRKIAIPIDLNDRASLIKNAKTSLSSKVVSQYSDLLAPIAVDAVLKVIDAKTADNVDLKDIRIVKKLGGTIEDSCRVDGIVFTQGVSHAAGGVSRVENAKIGLIQFQLSAPKTNMDCSSEIKTYTQMDRVMKQHRKYIANLIKEIKSTGCNVLLIQKSILRDATNDQALQLLAKRKILVVEDIERSEIEFISKTLNAAPIASIESFKANKLGTAKLVEEMGTSEGKIIRVTGAAREDKTVSILVRGSNKLVLDEAERSIHDALCVIRSLVKEKYMLVGGGAPEIEMSLDLNEYANTLSGMEAICIKGFAEALEVIPETLAENAGLNPIKVVTELRNRHKKGEKTSGINVNSGTISDMTEQNVVQPLLVTSSAIKLATETVSLILKIDGIVHTIR